MQRVSNGGFNNCISTMSPLLTNLTISLLILTAAASSSGTLTIHSGQKIINDEPATNLSTSCGGLLFGSQGLIEYKPSEVLVPFERCIWTIRTPSLNQIRFTLNKNWIENEYDVYVSVHMLNSTGDADVHEFTYFSQEPTILLNGSVAIIILTAPDIRPPNRNYTGFSLSFLSEGSVDDTYLNYQDWYTNNVDPDGGSLRYPVEGTTMDMEFSTFVFTHPTGVAYMKVAMNFTSLDLEVDENGECKDKLYIFLNLRHDYHTLLLISKGICQLDQVPDPYIMRSSDSLVFLLITDNEGGSKGFDVNWETCVINGACP